MAEHPKDKPADPDAWASLEVSDDWHEQGGRLRPSATASGKSGFVLLVVAGAQVGQRLPVPVGPCQLGRSKSNDVVLADASISREHAKLLLRPDGLLVTDLRSGNGTFIDGEKMGEGLVSPGHEVGFGHVRMVFLAPGMQAAPSAVAMASPKASPAAAVPPVAPTPRRLWPPAWPSRWPWQGPQNRRFLAIAAAAAALLVWSGVVWRNQSRRYRAFAAVQEGATAYVEHRWDEAEQAFVNAQQSLPGYLLADRWLQSLSRARRDEERLAEAKEALGQGDLPRALGLLQPLSDSPLQARAFSLQQEWQTSQHTRLLAAEAALQAQLPHEAEALLEQVQSGAAPRPDRLGLMRWQRRLSELAPLAQRARTYAQKPHKQASLWEQAASQTPAMRAALRAFRARAAGEAAVAARRALKTPSTEDERRLLADIDQFERLFDAGVEEHRNKRAFAAIKVLVEAKAIATRLVGRPPVLHREIDAKLADMDYVLGMQALADGKLPEAAEALRAALVLNPRHALSLRQMQQIESRAQRMLDEADFVRKSHPQRAKELLQQVVATFGPREATGQQARRMLAGMR